MRVASLAMVQATVLAGVSVCEGAATELAADAAGLGSVLRGLPGLEVEQSGRHRRYAQHTDHRDTAQDETGVALLRRRIAGRQCHRWRRSAGRQRRSCGFGGDLRVDLRAPGRERLGGRCLVQR